MPMKETKKTTERIARFRRASVRSSQSDKRKTKRKKENRSVDDVFFAGVVGRATQTPVRNCKVSERILIIIIIIVIRIILVIRIITITI